MSIIVDLLSQNSLSINTLTNSRTAKENATTDDQRQQAVLRTDIDSTAQAITALFVNGFLNAKKTESSKAN
jgi:hypothetical protein